MKSSKWTCAVTLISLKLAYTYKVYFNLCSEKNLELHKWLFLFKIDI